jgi:phenylalanyl-tRNA synthetase alpha chain
MQPDSSNTDLSLAESLHPLERRVLVLFKEGIPLSEQQLLKADPLLQPSQLSMALEWLKTKSVLSIQHEDRQEWVSLTDLGKSYSEKKNPAIQIADEFDQKGPTPLADLGRMLEPEERSSVIGALKKSGATTLTAGVVQSIDRTKMAEFVVLQQAIDALAPLNREVQIGSLSEANRQAVLAHHHKRGKAKGIFRVDERVLRTFAPTALFFPVYQKMMEAGQGEEINTLTPQMLKEGSWKDKRFRKYNIALSPPRIGFGRRHPYQVFLAQVREKLVSMGFSEMSGPLVESEFWNMDALYMPQFHPARAIHDVYFVKGPLYDETIPDPLVAKVASTHEGTHTAENGTGTSGWNYPFDIKRTRRLIMRSQGTAVSSRTLANAPTIPGKYFSIARCFRYDQVDATHAPDFFQVEGIVLGEEVHFRTLLGLLNLFAREIAKAEEIRFLPAYFPFTEPSVEMHVRHPKLGWIELGGAGLFRPEVTGPLGVDVPVIAWGLGLDRLAMMALKIADIRDLFSSDLDLIRAKAIPRERTASNDSPL